MTTKSIKATGNLTATPELKHTPDGKAVLNLRVAVNDSARTDDGDWHDLPPKFFDVAIWGHLAENLAAILTKGGAVGFEGKYRPRAWIDSDGQIRVEHKLVDADAWPDHSRATKNADQPAGDQ